MVVLQNAVEFEIAVERELVGMRGDSSEVRRQRLDVAQLSGNAEQEVFVDGVGVLCAATSVERELLGQLQHLAANAFERALVRTIVQRAGYPLANLLHLGLPHAASGQRRTSN